MRDSYPLLMHLDLWSSCHNYHDHTSIRNLTWVWTNVSSCVPVKAHFNHKYYTKAFFTNRLPDASVIEYSNLHYQIIKLLFIGIFCAVKLVSSNVSPSISFKSALFASVSIGQGFVNCFFVPVSIATRSETHVAKIAFIFSNPEMAAEMNIQIFVFITPPRAQKTSK